MGGHFGPPCKGKGPAKGNGPAKGYAPAKGKDSDKGKGKGSGGKDAKGRIGPPIPESLRSIIPCNMACSSAAIGGMLSSFPMKRWRSLP